MFKVIKFNIRRHIKKNVDCISPSKTLPMSKLLWLLEHHYRVRHPYFLNWDSLHYKSTLIKNYKKNYNTVDWAFILSRKLKSLEIKNKIIIFPWYIPYLLWLCHILKCLI